MLAAIPTSLADFDARLPALRQRIKARLVEECMPSADAPNLGASSSTDLYNLPKVDSKTVMKLAGLVVTALGLKLKPTDVKKGGYATLDDAVDGPLASIRKRFTEGLTKESSLTQGKAQATS